MRGLNLKAWMLAFAVLAASVTSGKADFGGEAKSVMLGFQAAQLFLREKYAEAVPVTEAFREAVGKLKGTDSYDYATALSLQAQVYHKVGRVKEAAKLYREAIAIYEVKLPPGDNSTMRDFNNLAVCLQDLKRPDEAEEILRHVLEVYEKSLGPDHPNVATALNNLGAGLKDRAHFAEAERVFRRALAIYQKANKPKDLSIAVSLSNLVVLYQETGRFAEAEPLMQKALAAAEAALAPNHPMLATMVSNHAKLLMDLNKMDEAEKLYRRALAIDEAKLGPESMAVARDLNALALLFANSNRYAEAEPLYRRAVAIGEKAGPDQLDLAEYLHNLAMLLENTHRMWEGVPLYRRALAIKQKIFGSDKPTVAITLDRLAWVYQANGDLEQAEKMQRQALAIHEKTYGPDHTEVAISRNNLGLMLQAQGRLQEAEASSRRAVSIMERTGKTEYRGMGGLYRTLALMLAARSNWQEALVVIEKAVAAEKVSARLRRKPGAGKDWSIWDDDAYKNHVLIAYRAGSNDPANRDRAFMSGQLALQSVAADALAQASARFAAGDGALALLIREQQDLSNRREGLNERLAVAVGKGDKAAADIISGDLKKLEARFAEITAILAKEFPEYASLANPEPLSIEAAQALLAPDEVLIQFIDLQPYRKAPETGFAWAITKNDVRWVELPIGTAGIAQHVAALRCGLDAGSWQGHGAETCTDFLHVGYPGEGQPLPFDLGRAHALYQALFGQFEDMLKGKHILIAPSGALNSLPFQVLVVDKPEVAIPGKWQGYRGVRWLGREAAITVLPSIGSLRSLRVNAKPSKAAEPFVGFGDPVLTGGPDCPKIPVPTYCQGESSGPVAENRAAPKAKSWAVAALQSFFRNGRADVNAVRHLCPLPDTAHELRCVSRSLDAPANRVVLGKAATETAVKHSPLAQYKVVHFATHGLLSNESATLGKGLGEPALVLTPPDTPTDEDDGLLTASEVAQLKLDAEWVVLSACNTASAMNNNAEALSGLARAFFYSGARTLLVSHWPVDSNAATAITSLTFKAQRDAHGIRPAEALRRSTAALMDDRRPWNAHPTFWAPFVVVGSGM